MVGEEREIGKKSSGDEAQTLALSLNHESARERRRVVLGRALTVEAEIRFDGEWVTIWFYIYDRRVRKWYAISIDVKADRPTTGIIYPDGLWLSEELRKIIFGGREN